MLLAGLNPPPMAQENKHSNAYQGYDAK